MHTLKRCKYGVRFRFECRPENLLLRKLSAQKLEWFVKFVRVRKVSIAERYLNNAAGPEKCPMCSLIRQVAMCERDLFVNCSLARFERFVVALALAQLV